MNPENKSYVSIHIPRTGGTSLREFFPRLFGPENTYFYYPNMGGLFRSDNQPVHFVQFNPRMQKLRDLMLYSKPGQLLYSDLYEVLNMLRKDRKITLPDGGKIIHGHFRPSRIELHNHLLITVVRDPLERTKSHYRWINQAIEEGLKSPATYWFNPQMTFEDFALSERLVNFQAKWIGSNLDQFHHVGITENIDKYVAQLTPTGNNLLLNRLNCFERTIEISTSSQFLEKFKQIYKDDYNIYNEAMSRIHPH